ncbi:hypothetical protein AB833_22000 [Chromatiales bacterium (ex Bugula neritina AB1)]|nr:hypothetical protein AB833_22000 [Chromatiales bacterium (ex Bugula neritina AB1)]
MLKSLYAKLALTLILLLFVTALVYSTISYSLTRQRIMGDLQRENADIAANLAAEIPQTVAAGIDGQFTEQLFHLMKIVNPDVELYLLDKLGAITKSSVENELLARDTVSMQPLQQFLDGTEAFPLFAQDPRTLDQPVTFSVAKLYAGDKDLGYLYVTLRGKDHETYQRGRAIDLISTIGLYALIGSLLVSLLAGLYIFRRITSRLQILSCLIHDFEHTGYRQSQRYAEIAMDRGDDEISRLGISFDGLSKRIGEQFELLEAQDQNRRSFLANISHDLRTPLTATQGYLEMLQHKYDSLDDSQRRKYLGISLKHSKRLQNLITNLFELAKLEDYNEELNREIFSLSDLVNDVLQGSTPLAMEKCIDLGYTSDVNPLLVTGDLAMIDRVVSNLVSNALQYTQQNGKVEITLTTVPTESGKKAKFVIEDNGPGIDPTQINNIFRRFHRADNQHSSGSNAGLGLTIAQRIIQLHSSQLTVENTGNGTRFSFEL